MVAVIVWLAYIEATHTEEAKDPGEAKEVFGYLTRLFRIQYSIIRALR